MALVDLKMSKKDMVEEASPVAQQSKYPYGLCLRLDGDELDKLGIKSLPGVGDEFHIEAVGEVTAVSETDSGNGESRHVEIQIQMMELTNEGQEAGDESVAEEEAEDAESSEVGGNPKTMLQNSYRGRR